MEFRHLSVEGAVEFGFPVFPDDRGCFASSLMESDFVRALGRRPFRPGQVSFTRSRKGVVRGVHYTATPPGCAKFVHCPAGRALDMVVDLRVGSPTWGRWDSVLIGPDSPKAVYLPVGVGHAVLALEEGTVITYLLSEEYVPANELGVDVHDPELGLPLPEGSGLIRSARDASAPTVAKALEAGLLPTYEDSIAGEKGLTEA